MVSLIVNIEKKHIYFFVFASLFLLILGVAYAFASKDPTVHGHSMDEMDARWVSFEPPKFLTDLPWEAERNYYGYNYSGLVPSDAKAVFFNVFIAKGDKQEGWPYEPSGQIVRYLFCVKERKSDLCSYYYPVYAYDYANKDSWDVVSDSFWMPVTSDKTLYLALNRSISMNYNGKIHVIGYR